MSHHDDKHNGDDHHSILTTSTALKTFGALIFLTVVTVAVARVDLGWINTPLAMLVAIIKAGLVIWFFMELGHDKKDNKIIFGTSFIFLAIFFILTASDLFTRKDRNKDSPESVAALQSFESKAQAASAATGPKFLRPWNQTPEIMARGKELFGQQCIACHGENGMGDGAAAAGYPATNKPRNFHSGDGWKNGRKLTQVYGTLNKGLAPFMPSFSTLPKEDIWALAHYVLSLGPDAPKSTDADLKAMGVNPNEDLKSSAKKTLPIEFTIKRVTSGS